MLAHLRYPAPTEHADYTGRMGGHLLSVARWGAPVVIGVILMLGFHVI